MGWVNSRQTMVCLTCSVGHLVSRGSVVSKCPQCVLLSFALLCLKGWMISPTWAHSRLYSHHLFRPPKEHSHTGRTRRHPHHQLHPQICALFSSPGLTWCQSCDDLSPSTLQFLVWAVHIHRRQCNQCSARMVSPVPPWPVQGTVWPKLSYLHQALQVVFPWSKSSISPSLEFL